MFLDRGRATLVLPLVRASDPLDVADPPAQNMGLIHAALIVLTLGFFAIAECCLGGFLLARLQLTFESFAEQGLIAVATGVVASEIVISLAAWSQHIRAGSAFLALVLLASAAFHFRKTWASAALATRKVLPLSLIEKLLCGGIGIAAVVEYAATMAPLTGSDALNYHFTTQKVILESGFHPDFSLVNSFLCGQSHMLILLGLALGSEQFAMALIFLGGLLSALCVFMLARRWTSREIALLFTLVFVLTPIVFWQASTSGAPDIWMAVFVGTAALVLANRSVCLSWRHAALAGFLAGGIAGAKYTGCIFAAVLAIAFLIETRSAKKTSLFFAAAIAGGIWPYLRNFVWTGDPVFPFMTSQLDPAHANYFALANLRGDTGAALGHPWGAMAPYILFVGQQMRATAAFWQFYGPIILALAPLTLLAIRNTREWRVLLLTWVASGAGTYLVSGLVRFLLPVFPIALACAAAGVAEARSRGWAGTYRLVWGSTALLVLLGAGGLLIYTRPALALASGMVSREAYLEARAPDYNIAQAVNRSLGETPRTGKTLVFIRHLYYLDVPFVYGNPGGSWTVDPALLKTPAEWQAFFHRANISYVVRSPQYPKEFEESLGELEKEGALVPLLEKNVDNFAGNRIAGKRVELQMEIFRVAAGNDGMSLMEQAPAQAGKKSGTPRE